MLEHEDTARALVGSIQTMGRDVRSTPMQWSYERKKLSAAVQFLSWKPPWVLPSTGADDVPERFIAEAQRVPDHLGLGRIPSLWWTLNPKYNSLYEIHCLNVRSVLGRAAVGDFDGNTSGVRFDFVKAAPDIATFMIALRMAL